jgi:hypothetical protein
VAPALQQSRLLLRAHRAQLLLYLAQLGSRGLLRSQRTFAGVDRTAASRAQLRHAAAADALRCSAAAARAAAADALCRRGAAACAAATDGRVWLGHADQVGGGGEALLLRQLSGGAAIQARRRACAAAGPSAWKSSVMSAAKWKAGCFDNKLVAARPIKSFHCML